MSPDGAVDAGVDGTRIGYRTCNGGRGNLLINKLPVKKIVLTSVPLAYSWNSVKPDAVIVLNCYDLSKKTIAQLNIIDEKLRA